MLRMREYYRLKKLKRHNDQMQYINFNKIPNWEEAADYKRHFGDKDKI